MKIKIKYSGVIPTGQYQNEQPTFEIENEVRPEEAVKAKQDILDVCYTMFQDHKEKVLDSLKSKEEKDYKRLYDNLYKKVYGDEYILWTKKKNSQKVMFVLHLMPGAAQALADVKIDTIGKVEAFCEEYKWQYSKIESAIIAIGESLVKPLEADEQEDLDI